jgi:charged multivesicular body protein 5
MQYDMEELLEQANEVQESLSQSYAVPDEIDEADLEAGACLSPQREYWFLPQGLDVELDALGMEEEEGESYLADLNKAPDFIDEAPIEAPEVRDFWFP